MVKLFICIDVDEVIYNFYIMIRFDLELVMLEGKLVVKDFFEVWNECYKRDLGIVFVNDS